MGIIMIKISIDAQVNLCIQKVFLILYTNKDTLTNKLNELNTLIKFLQQQELSYRKQIVRQLRTQYVESIYDNHVTLKSMLPVTQCHWKRNH